MTTKPKRNKAKTPAPTFHWATDELPELSNLSHSSVSFAKQLKTLTSDAIEICEELSGPKSPRWKSDWIEEALDAVVKCQKRMRDPIEAVFREEVLLQDEEDDRHDEMTEFLGHAKITDEICLGKALKELKLEKLAALEEASRGRIHHIFYWCYRRDFLLPLIKLTITRGKPWAERMNLFFDEVVHHLECGDEQTLITDFISKELACFFTEAVLKQQGETHLVVAWTTPVITGSFEDTILKRVPRIRNILSGKRKTEPEPIPVASEFTKVEFSEDFKKVYFDDVLGIDITRSNCDVVKLLNVLYRHYHNFVSDKSGSRASGETPKKITAAVLGKNHKGRSLTVLIKDRPKKEKALLRKIITTRKILSEEEKLTLNTTYQYGMKK